MCPKRSKNKCDLGTLLLVLGLRLLAALEFIARGLPKLAPLLLPVPPLSRRYRSKRLGLKPVLRWPLLAPPLPPVLLVGAPALEVPKALLHTQSRRQAAALPTRPRRPTRAERAEEVPGAGLELLLPLLLSMAVAVVGAAMAAKSDTPTTTLVAAVGVVVVVAVGAVVVEGAAVAVTTPPSPRRRSYGSY